MLRITLLRESVPPTLKLEGKLSGPWVPELEHSWREIQRHGLVGSVPIDLSDVSFISSEGKTLLKVMFQQGANLQSRSLMTRFIINQIKNGSNGSH
ncbi:MAG: hypothetical protein ACRD2G_15120 [Terriglobia bacterium]